MMPGTHAVGVGQVKGETMASTVDALILDLLDWIGPVARPYSEVMDAWRTSCPRLPVWEEANERGFLARSHEPGREVLVSVSPSGRAFLEANRAFRPVEH